MTKQFPEPVVGCFILNEKREILLVKSYKWPDHWAVMGGHIELGESIETAALREVKEELGIDVDFVRVIRVAEIINPPEHKSPIHLLSLQCECLLRKGGSIQPDHDEIQEARWFSLSDALKLPNLLENTRDALNALH